MDRSRREDMNGPPGERHLTFRGRLVVAAVLPLFALSLAALVQDRPPTIRRHVVEVDNPMYPPDLAEAEAAMDKSDYATAEPLLKKVVEHNPANYRAWFDL